MSGPGAGCPTHSRGPNEWARQVRVGGLGLALFETRELAIHHSPGVPAGTNLTV